MNIFFNKDKYKLERIYELICYMIVNYNPKNSIDRHRIEGLESARRTIAEFMNKNDCDEIAKRIITNFVESR